MSANHQPADWEKIMLNGAGLSGYDSSSEPASELRRIEGSRANGSAISVALIDEHAFTRQCIARSLRELDTTFRVLEYATYDDCISDEQKLDIVLYHYHEFETNELIASDRLEIVKSLLQTGPVIIMGAADCPDWVIEALESGARGYIPTAGTTVELAIEILRLVKAGGTFVPPSSLLSRIVNWRIGTRTPVTAHQFTPRQMAVLERLKRGEANKIIAYELEMSESTVKVHIRNIMKKMKATNRTEVACRAFAWSQTRTVAPGEPD